MKGKLYNVLIGSGFLYCSPLLLAAEQTPSFSQGLSAGYYLRLGAALVLVLAVFFVFAWVLKRFNRIPASQNGLHIVSGLNVGNKEKLLVVQVGKKQLLLGVTANSISKLHQLDEAIDDPLSVQNANFGSVLKSALGARGSS